ncbi:hypothetical protein [Halodesulfovibrio aestuarii]|uniref:hypothetical protein n=1 Tax=Halodesulfovibrio aestuarii TaxID=126333 RepID=UPI003D335684
MPNNGTYSQLDMASVKSSAEKSITYLNKVLPDMLQKQKKPYVVIFLGESHMDHVDQEVTRAMLLDPPVLAPNQTRVIYERQLDTVYPVISADFNSQRTEPRDLALSRKERSKILADMIQDAFENYDMTMVYMPCGSAHAQEIFDSMDKRFANLFLFIVKMSSTD